MAVRLIRENDDYFEDDYFEDDFAEDGYNGVSNELPEDVDNFLMDFAQVYGGITYEDITDFGAVWDLLKPRTQNLVYNTINQIEEACDDTGLDYYEAAEEYADVKNDCEQLIDLVKGHMK